MPDPVVMAVATGLAAVVAAAVAWLVGKSRLPGGALGAGMGVLVGWWILGVAPRIPPREAIERFLVVLAPLSLLAETIIASPTQSQTQSLKRLGWGLRAVAAMIAAPVLLYGSSYVTDLSGPGSREWSTGLAIAIFAGLATALFLIQLLMTKLATRASKSTAVVLAGTMAGAALTIMLSGYASGGQLGFPLAAAIGVFAIFGSRHVPSAAAFSIAALFALLVVGRFFAGLTTQSAVILFAAPLLGWVPEIPKLRRFGPRVRGGLRIALAAIAVIATIGLAQQKFAADSASPSDEGGESSSSDYLQFGK